MAAVWMGGWARDGLVRKEDGRVLAVVVAESVWRKFSSVAGGNSTDSLRGHCRRVGLFVDDNKLPNRG